MKPPLDLLRKNVLGADVQAALDYIVFMRECAKDTLTMATDLEDVKRLRGQCAAYRDLYEDIAQRQMPVRKP